MTKETNPVWTVYDKLRTASLNVKYYSRRLQKFERIHFGMDFILLCTAPSSAIAGLWFWQTPSGRHLWQYLGGIAALVAILKPLLSLTKRIKEYEGVLSGYRMLEFDLKEIKSSIEQKKRFDQQQQSEYKKAVQREKTLVGRAPETRENSKVIEICEKEVLREMPYECFFIPEDELDGK